MMSNKSKARDFVEASRAVSIVTSKVTANNEVNADQLNGYDSTYFATQTSVDDAELFALIGM